MKSPAIQKRFVRTSFGNIAYLETGTPTQPPVLFVHGIPTSGYLWREVLRFLQTDFHCYAPDLMGLGDTDVDPATASFDMGAQAEMLAEFMTVLGHEQFGLVCHDQGGAAVLLMVARMPQRVAALVITDCVCYDNWPVPAIARWQKLLRIPFGFELLGRIGAIEWLQCSTKLSDFRRGVYQRHKISDAAISEYLRPLRGDHRARERFRRFFLAGHPRYTLAAVDGMRQFTKPTLILWAADDNYISASWGRKLYEEIPGAERFELIPFCGHFWQEERPSEFASHMAEFFGRHLSERQQLAAANQEEPNRKDPVLAHIKPELESLVQLRTSDAGLG